MHAYKPPWIRRPSVQYRRFSKTLKETTKEEFAGLGLFSVQIQKWVNCVELSGAGTDSSPPLASRSPPQTAREIQLKLFIQQRCRWGQTYIPTATINKICLWHWQDGTVEEASQDSLLALHTSIGKAISLNFFHVRFFHPCPTQKDPNQFCHFPSLPWTLQSYHLTLSCFLERSVCLIYNYYHIILIIFMLNVSWCWSNICLLWDL